MSTATHFTMVPSDGIMILEGQALFFKDGYSLLEGHEAIHAAQWHEGKGELEWTDGRGNTEADYEKDVAPYVEMYEAEKARLAEEEAERKRLAEEEYNSEEARAKRIRAERDSRLAACDYKMTADLYAAMTSEQQAAWTAYRQALRDFTSLEGFPWDGDVETAPWPVQPE